MIEYLTEHFRYNTMSSWNSSTSYAAKVKVTTFVPSKLIGRALELLEVEEAFDPIHEIMSAWDRAHDYQFQVGFNGRSNGYIVMYQGGYTIQTIYLFKETDSEGKQEYSDLCGWLTHKEAKDRGLVNYPWKRIHSHPGKSLDQGETFENWSTDDIRERVKLVQSFDTIIEECKKMFIHMCECYRVEEEAVMVSHAHKVLVEA
jgi:hypothetical protein